MRARRLLFLLLPGLFLADAALAVPGDVLFSEDFESGVPGWVQTVGPSGAWGVNAAFGYNAGYVAGDSEVRVETPVVDLAIISGARITLTIIRGKQTVQGGVTVSNKPENDENFELDFLDADGNWQTVLVQYGGGTAGEVFISVVDLPSAALHANFQLRFGTWGGDPWDGEPYDFWHFDDIRLIETASAGGDVSACTFGDDFESGLGNWTAAGAAAVSTATYNSPDHSLALPAAGSEVVSTVVDLSGKTASVSAWIRAGGWTGGPDAPESTDELEFEYRLGNGNWSGLYTFCINCSNTASQKDVDVGGVALLDIDLPANALHANFQLRIRNDSASSSTTSDVWHIDNVCVSATAAADHFSIEHDGNAVNCQAEIVTIKAHASDHTVAKEYLGSISLSTNSTHGDWGLAVGLGSFTNIGNGSATYVFNAFDEGAVTLKLHNTFVETDNINVSDGTFMEHVDDDPDLDFAEAGFQFVDANTGLAPGVQIAGKPSDASPSNPIELQAIRTNDSTGTCEAAFVGATAVDIAMSCEIPGSCASAVGIVNGSNVATGNSGAPSSWTTLNLDFGDKTDSTAPVVFRYDEAGAMKLHARKILSPSNAVMGGNVNVVVRPFGLHIAVDQGGITNNNPGAADATGTIFEKAGDPFRVTVTAVGWQSADDGNDDGVPDGHDDTDPTNNADLSDNTALVNFAAEATPDSVALGKTLIGPVGGTDPALSGTTTVSGFTSGVSTIADDVTYTFGTTLTAPYSLTIRATDGDSISSNGYSEDQTEIRSGRLYVGFAAAPENRNAIGRLLVEEWNGADWSVSTADSCTSYGTTANDEIRPSLLLYSYSPGNLGSPEGQVSAGTFANGEGTLTYAAPGVGNDGDMQVTVDVPAWLEYDWNGSGAEDPVNGVMFRQIHSTETGMIDNGEVVGN